MGLTQLALKNYGRAIRHFQESYKLDPQVATGLNLSSALIESGNYSGAEKLLKALSKEATKIKYRYKERIFHNLGYCAFKQKNTKRAEEWFKLSLEENPTFFPAHLELARLYDSSQRKALAIESYRQALDYCRTCLDPLEPLAKLYVSAGQGNEAKRLITQYLRNEDLTEIDRQKALALLSRIPNQAPNPGTLSRSLDSVSGVESIKQ